MLSHKRAIVVAALLLTVFLLLRNTYPSHNDTPSPEEVRVQLLRKQLSHAFPYDWKHEFPAYIWQTWKYSPSHDEFHKGLRSDVASWTDLHPSHVHTVASDSDAESLVNRYYASIPEVQQAYAALPEPVLKADFFRYLILLAQGGIYSDIDTTALKPAVSWVPEHPTDSYGLVVGIEADPDRADWHEWYSRRIQFCQWTIQSKPGHPILVAILASITEETLRKEERGELNEKHMKSVMEFTGPGIWTDTIFKYLNNPEYFDTSTTNVTWQHFTNLTHAMKVGDVIVLPITSFSPGVGHMGAGEFTDPMAFVRHGFAGTWKHSTP